MTTPAHQINLTDLEQGSSESRLAQAFYVLRRWPIIPIFILSVLAICAVFAPQIAPYEPEQDQLRAVLGSPPWYPPCEEGQITNKFESCNTNGIPLGRDEKVYFFALGADQLGRDLLSRIIYGARLSLSLAAIAIAIGTVFGTTVGLVAGYYGGIIDEVIMRIVDVFNAIPYILLAIALVLVLDQSFAIVAFVLALGAWAGIARPSARPDAASSQLRLHSAGARRRRVHAAHNDTPPDARRRQHRGGGKHAAGRQHNPVRKHPVLPRRGRPAANAVLGRGHIQRQGVSRLRLVGGVLPRNGDIPDRAILQLHRRLAARPLGSAPASDLDGSRQALFGEKYGLAVGAANSDNVD